MLLGWLEPEPEGFSSARFDSSLRMPPLRAGLGPELLKLLEEQPPPAPPPP
tara:strand:- start:205 stop:357 length:153 start_codon:yes stop_codon:yes gene_type:complete